MQRKIITFILTGALLSYMTAAAANDPTINIVPVYQYPSRSGTLLSNTINAPGEVYFFDENINSKDSYGVLVPYTATKLEEGIRIVDFDFMILVDKEGYDDGYYMPISNVYSSYGSDEQITATLQDDGTGTYLFSGNTSPTSMGYIKSSMQMLDSSTVFNVSVSIVTYPSSLSNLFIQIDLYDIVKTDATYYLEVNTPVNVHISDTSMDELQDTLTDNFSTVNDNLSAIQSGLSSVVDSISSGNTDVITSMEAVEQAIRDFKEAYPEMSQQATEGALDSFFNKLKQEAVDTSNDVVNSIQEQLNIDISGIQTATETLYTSISTHEAQPNLRLKAGTVSVSGETYTFWDEQNINFDEVLNNEWIQLALIPLRFVFVFGFGRYLISVIKRVESIVTMNGGDD